MLAYTLDRLMHPDGSSPLYEQQALIQRDVSESDAHGAQSRARWQDHLTVPCRMWWDKASGARGANRENVSPARTVPLANGAMILEPGTDVTETDRITRIERKDPETGEWVPEISGTIEIVSVLTLDTHVEVQILRAHLGG